MGFAPFHCALGDSPEVELQAGTEIDIAPPDNPPDADGVITNPIDTNRVRVVGAGTVESLGFACGGAEGEIGEIATVTKRIAWMPSGAGIILKNSPQLRLLGGVDRTITTPAFGYYASDVDGNWQEESYARADVSPINQGGLVAIITYVASGPITIPAHATRGWVRMWGGTGASGAGQADGSGGVYASAGVGSGGLLEAFLTGLTPGNTLTFTLGAAGVATAGAGGNGGDTILASGTQTITTLTARGSHGTPLAAAQGPGSIGGSASGGDTNRTGQTGGPSIGAIPGVGGAFAYSHGPDGSTSVSIGNNGNPGGLVIAWFNDALA